MSPRARAIATGALLGDPPPGRTPWAPPAQPNEVQRTGVSVTSGALGQRMVAPESETVAEVRRKIESEIAMAPKQPVSGPIMIPVPATTGFTYGAQPSDQSGQLPANMDGVGDADVVDTLRPVAALAFPVIGQEDAPTDPPMIEWMAPTDLLIEGRYQRDISQASDTLIRKITLRWDWRRFKPPVVAWTERGFEIIDGQHTAIAAATRGIEKISVLVIEAAEVQDRAAAFIGHNRDRVAVTAPQMHVAAVAAGDDDAVTVQQVLDRAGARLLTKQWGKQKYRAGDTMAVAAVGALVGKRGAMKARQVLEVLVKAEAAPISAAQIKAVDMLMSRPEYAEIDLVHLPATIRDLDDIDPQAKHDAKTFACPVWEAMGRIWFAKCKKQRRTA